MSLFECVNDDNDADNGRYVAQLQQPRLNIVNQHSSQRLGHGTYSAASK